MKTKFFTVLTLFLAVTIKAQWAGFSTGNTNGTVVDFEIVNNDLYAAGLFNQINGTPVNYIGKWNGTGWQQVGGGFTDATHSVAYIDSTLFVARYEFQVDSNWIYYLSNNVWKKLGKGFYLTGASAGNYYTCSLYDVIKYNGDYYACGEFNKNGNQAINGIARWDGSNWQPLGTGLSTPMSGQVIYPHNMKVFNNKLYVCGNFKTAGGIVVNGVAAWDGINWSAVGTGFNSVVYGLGIYNNQLYAGGDFTADAANTATLNAIARWNGSAWTDPGFGFTYTSSMMYNFVHTFETIQNKLYIAGGFNRCTTTGVSPTTYTVGSIVAYDGTNISTLAGGANNDVEGITWWQNKLLIGGFFSTVGTGPGLVSASKLATFDTLNIATGLNEVDLQNPRLVIYPNPSNGVFMVKAPAASTLYVHNHLGQLVKIFTLAVNINEQAVDLTGYAEGLYVLRASIGGGNELTQKLALKK